VIVLEHCRRVVDRSGDRSATAAARNMHPEADRWIARGSPFELSPTEDGTLVFRHGPRNLNELYRRAYASARQVCIATSGTRFSYGDLFSRAQRLSGILMRRAGARAGERIAIALPDGAAWLTAFVAVTCTGATAVTVHRAMTGSQLARALDDTACTSVIVDEAAYSLLRDFGDRRPGFLLASGGGAQLPADWVAVDDSDLTATAPSPAAWMAPSTISPQDEALIGFTSGTTGEPKGVISTHAALLSGVMTAFLGSSMCAARVRHAVPSSPAQAGAGGTLMLSPFSHVGGYVHLLSMMMTGGRTVLLERWDPRSALEALAGERATSLGGATPAMLRELLRSESAPAALATLRSIGLQGSSVQENLIDEIRRALPSVTPFSSFGLTETNGPVCMAGGAELERQAGICGPPVPSVQIRVEDGEGNEVACGETGEICLRGAMLMSGYCRASGKPVRSSFEGSWFRTGDLGHFDSRGYLYLSDRRHDCVEVRGRPMARGALERAIRELPCVDEVATIFERGEGGERVVVFAVLNRPEIRIHDQIAEHLQWEARGAGPALEVRTVRALPRTAAGKVNRRRVREWLGTPRTLSVELSE
jgi:long-chain acyl-CoA synthetase